MWALALLLLVFLSGRSLQPTLRSAAFCEHFSDCAVTGTHGSPHQHHGRERALPDHWDHLWLLSLRPSVNPYQVANELGYQNLGEVVAFPGHFVFRSRQKARCRQLVSLDLLLEAPRKEKGRKGFFSLYHAPVTSAWCVVSLKMHSLSLLDNTLKKSSMYSSETAYHEHWTYYTT